MTLLNEKELVLFNSTTESSYAIPSWVPLRWYLLLPTGTSASFIQPSVRPAICHLMCMNVPVAKTLASLALGGISGSPMKVNCCLRLQEPREDAESVPLRTLSTDRRALLANLRALVL